MLKPRKASPTESPLPFTLDPKPLEETLTSYGGLPLVVQAFRSLGLPGSVQRDVKVKVRQRGYDEATFVESFVVLNALGGECLEDFERLREDGGLASVLGHVVPSPEAARKFLYAFHDEELIEAAKAARGPDEIAYIPEENAPLRGLGRVNRELVRQVGQRCPDQRIATVDQDATVIESGKEQALRSYEGERGYQPMVAVWAEMDLVLADEFRDGNVPAGMAPLRVAQAAFAALPSTVETYYYRGDSACHEHELVDWLRDSERAKGPKGLIGFAISARMSPALQEAVKQVSESGWEPYGEAHPNELRECADVDFVPGEVKERKDTQPIRYVAIRIRKRQGELFDDGALVKHYAVLSNMWDTKAPRLIEWHREKAGTIEGIHDVLKNELAGGILQVLRSKRSRVVPSGGADAQRTDGVEADRAAGRIAPRPPEAAAILDLQHAGPARASRASAGVARGDDGGASGGMVGGVPGAAGPHLMGEGKRVCLSTDCTNRVRKGCRWRLPM